MNTAQISNAQERAMQLSEKMEQGLRSCDDILSRLFPQAVFEDRKAWNDACNRVVTSPVFTDVIGQLRIASENSLTFTWDVEEDRPLPTLQRSYVLLIQTRDSLDRIFTCRFEDETRETQLRGVSIRNCEIISHRLSPVTDEMHFRIRECSPANKPWREEGFTMQPRRSEHDRSFMRTEIDYDFFGMLLQSQLTAISSILDMLKAIEQD